MNPAQPFTRFAFRHVALAAAVLTAGLLPWPALAGGPDEEEAAALEEGVGKPDAGKPPRASSPDDFDFGDLRERSPEPAVQPVDRQQQTGDDKPKPKKEYDKVDWGNQDGPSEAREKLAEVIGTSRVGFDRETLARASYRDLQLLKTWFGQVREVAPDFIKNTEHARKKMKGDLASQTNYSLYKARTDGVGDNQDDKDDFRVVSSFLRFTRDQQPQSPLLKNVSEHLRDLIVASGPAYKVPITPEEALDPDVLAKKFERDLDKGALQYPAIYLQALMIDNRAFEAAMHLSQTPDDILGFLNQPATRSRFDDGSDRSQQPGANEPAELATARRDAAAASERVAQAERGLVEATQGLPRGAGRWTREALLNAMIQDPKIDGAKIAAAAQKLADARKADAMARRDLGRMQQDAAASREGGATLARRYEQLAQVLGKTPEGVELKGNLAKHREVIEKRLAASNPDTISRAIFEARRDPVKVAQLVKEADRTEKAVHYQVTAEDSMKKLAAQKAALTQAAEGIKLTRGAPADLQGEVDKIKADLAAQTSATWEAAFWEERGAAAVRTKADALSKDLAAIGDRMKALTSRSQQVADRERTEQQINQAQRTRFQEDLAATDSTEVTLASPVPGKVKPHVTRGVLVLDRQGNRVGALPSAEKADIVGALLQSADASSAVRAFRIKIPEKFRKMKRVEEGFVPSQHFGPVDADAMSAALAAAKPEAETGAGDEPGGGEGTPSPDQEKDRLLAEASAQFWSRLQMASADLERGIVKYVMEVTDRTWPANNACRFKDVTLKRMRDALDKYDKAVPGSVDRAAYEQLARMENSKELSNSNLEKEAAAYGKEQLKRLEASVKDGSVTKPPSFYRWGVAMSVVEAR
ncbi:MAG: hypothetical protein HYY25_08255 [Candidatus Wallbacteria bacterium]|nr:hypothetical protein [Candidatus Wallbacteria bacterium]